MPESIDILITHAHLFTMQGEGVGYIPDGEVQMVDEIAIQTEAQSEAEKVARKIAADPVHKNMALLAAMKIGQL